MTGNNNLTHSEGALSCFTSPAVVVSVLLAILGAYLWADHPEQALVVLLWVPILLACSVMHYWIDIRHPRGSSH
jgi:hypothetical protein